MKLILRFLILLSVFGFSQRSLAFTAENLKTKENLQETNYQFNELQMNQIICNDSLFVAELSFTAVNPSPWGYIVLVDGMFYSFELFSDSLVQTFVLEINDPSLGSEIFVEVIDGNLIAESNFLLECDAPCSIGEPIITVLDCNDSLGVFSVELDFEYENVESAQFEVHGNATHYGTFQYTDLPIVLEGFEGNGDMVYELIAYDHEDSLCSSGYGFFGPVSCPEVMNDCITFEDFDLGFYTLPDSLSEVYLGTYQSVDLSAHPFSTGNPNFPFVWGGLGIVDSDNNPIGQISGNAVNYENTTVEFDFMHFLGANVLSVSFDYVSLLDGVNFGINSNDYDYLPSYSQISNNIPGLDINVSSTSIGNNEVGSVTILGDISNLIIGGFYGYLDNICFEYLEDIDCELSALNLTVSDCDTSDELNFNFDFDYSGVNEEGFLLVGYNNDYFAQFDYADLPVTINDLGTEVQENYSFGIITLGSPDTCSIDLDFETPACYLDNPCEITSINYSIVDCNPLDSSFYVNVWFDYDNLDSLSVSIFGSGYDWGEFDAWEQPVTLGPYYGDQGVYEVIIQDTYDSECLDVLAVDSPSCLYTDCGIDWIQYEVVDCNPLDTSFYLNIWFDNNSLDSSMVSIFGDGYDWGEFDASEQPVQIGPFIGLESSYEVIIQNTNDPACFKGLAVDSPACFYTDCYLDFSNYNIIECSDTDSTFYLELYFNYDNLEGDAVSIFGGGYDWGIFNPEIQPIVVGPYFSGQTNYEVIVADQLNPNCSSAIDFGPVDCSEDCSINIMEYNIIECSETDSTFYVEVLFEYENLLGDAVSIFGGGYNWGIFNPALQPMLIGPFFTGDLVYEILVADQLDLECYDLVEFEFTGCGVDCNLIEEIWIADGPDCQGDLCEIEIGVDLSQAGANESVDIHLGGFSYYDYPPSQLDGVYFDFQQDSLIESSLIVCISGSFDCCDTLYFDLPSNGSEFVWPGDANSDNIANNIDLLYIGLADGFQGIERSNFGISWEAYESEDWPFSFPESLINFKHADSNGDAVVDLEDIGAIIENYGLTHGVYEPDSVQGGIGDPPLFIDLPSFVEPGETIEADIDLGVISNPVQDLYGIAFTLEFPEDVFVNNNIEFDFTDSWIGEIDQDLYSLQQPIEGVFEIDIALVRNNQENADANYGRIGNFIGVIDDVLGIEQVNVKIKDVHAISNNEILIPLNLPVDTMLISSTDQLLEDIRINVYPIPTNKFLYLDTDIAEEVISMEILNSSGIQVKHYDQFESRLDLKALLNGIYLLRVKTSKGIYQERIMIFN
jgi:hypothetical protein